MLRTASLAGLLILMGASLAMLVLGYILLQILIGALFLLLGFLLGTAALAGSLAMLRRGPRGRVSRVLACGGGAFFALACLALIGAATKQYGGRMWLFTGPLLVSSLLLILSGLHAR